MGKQGNIFDMERSDEFEGTPVAPSAKKSRPCKALFSLARSRQAMLGIPALLGLAGKRSELAGSYRAGWSRQS